jgi:hypothetical protein
VGKSQIFSKPSCIHTKLPLSFHEVIFYSIESHIPLHFNRVVSKHKPNASLQTSVFQTSRRKFPTISNPLNFNLFHPSRSFSPTQETNAALQQQQKSPSDDPHHSPSPPTMAPQNYVQQLASALGINSAIASTDFESLIEMNRRQQQQQLNISNVRREKQQTIKTLKLTTFVEDSLIRTHLMNEYSLLLPPHPSPLMRNFPPSSLLYVHIYNRFYSL